MMNKINSLTKVFLKDYDKKSKIFNKKRNKDSNFFLIITIVIAVAFISYKIIEFFDFAGQPKIFLNLHFIILSIILMFQIVLVVMNVLIFSKDLENILPMPITPIELLLSKYGVLLIMTYITELVLGLIPLTIYGLLAHLSLLYFIFMPIVLAIFPALLITVISTIAILLMKIFKVIKNKNIYQTVITSFLIIIIFVFESCTMNIFSENNKINEELQNASTEYIEQQSIEMYDKMGEGLLIVNPAVEILANSNQITTVLLYFGKLLLYNVVGLGIFLLIGKTVYLKNILIGTTNIVSNKISNKKIKYNKRNKNVRKAYIENDFKQLIRNPIFFMQLVFPVIIILISAIIIGNVIIPMIDTAIQNDDTIKNSLEKIEINTSMICVILGIVQVLYSISGISFTAISREGKNAIYLKYIPIDLYKQFLYKNVLQIIFNLIVSIVVLLITHTLIPKISIIQMLLIFAICIFINLINSFLMLVVDLKRPQLKWEAEYQITKNNPNKVFQYVCMLVMILFLLYLAKILNEININIALIIQLVIFMVVFFTINILIKKNIKKLYKKII